MKTKTLFFSSLVAAAAMSTVPAWADNSTYDATNKKINWVSDDNAYKWVGSSSGAFSTAENWVSGTDLNGTPTWSDTNKAPVRVSNKGYLLYFDGTRQTISVSGGTGGSNVDTSDGGGIWVTGTGNTVTAFLGGWGGSIQVDAGNVLNTAWSQKFKDGHIVANGTVNITSGNLNFDGSGERTWFVGSDGSITFSAANTISTGTITLLGEVDTLSSELTNRTASGTTTLTKQLVAFSSSTGITTGLDSLTVGTISDAGTGTALESATSADSLTVGQYYADKSSSGVTVSYAVNTYAAETLTWAGTESSSVWVNKGDNWTNASNVQTSFLNGDSVTFNKANADVTVSGTVAPGVMTVSQATTLSGTGTVSVAAANLTTNATLTLNSDVKLDLGNLADGTNVQQNLAGTGTVSISKTSGNHNQTIDLGTDFAGTVDYKGNLDPTKVTSFGSASASVNFTDVYFWSGNNQTGTIANSINFSGTGNKIQAEATATLNLTGPITFSSGASFAVAKGTLNISGAVTDGNFTQTGGALKFSGTAEKTVGTISTTTGSSGATLSIAGETTVSATSFQNNYGLATLTVDGNLNVSETFKYGTGSTTNAITGTGTISAKTFDFGNAGTYNVSGATLEVGSGGITHTNAWGYTLKLGATTIKATSDFTVAGNTGGIGTGSTSLTDTATGTTFDTNGHTITVNSAFGGSGKLIKTGAGTLTLSGTNTFTGGVTISAGKVVANNANALGAAAGSVKIAGGQLEISSGVTLAQTNITIALSDAYSETAAILGEGALAEGTTITLTKAEESMIASLVEQTKEYQIFANGSSLASDFSVDNFSLDDEVWEGWKISNYDNGKVTLELIPEPSAFGLLAGVGALVFVAARRRRRAK